MGVAVAFVLLIAAVWVSGASTSTGLALTAVLILVGAASYAFANGATAASPPDDSDVQRERMRKDVP